MSSDNRVELFYDNFVEGLINDYKSFNRRQDFIKQLCKQFIPKNATVLEIGCGTGIVTRTILQIASKVVAVDISSNNIEVARSYLRKQNIDLYVWDVLSDQSPLEKGITFDAIVFADVIEHIQPEKVGELFRKLGGMLNNNGRIILAYPSIEYQQFLRKHKPSALQIIDEEIDLPSLLKKTLLKPIYFSYKNVWGNNQYVHLVLQSGIEYSEPVKSRVIDYVVYRIKKYSWRIRNYWFYRSAKKKISNRK
jgi:2-polyprenyl-3-methyl-5-hydroxy-6-metoxy-1,4-benzoquinol methylase